VRPTRTLKYEFQSLEGVIFGMKTSDEDKLQIASVIEQKCRAERRTDFMFYQARFSPESGTIEHSKMGLLKFTQ